MIGRPPSHGMSGTREYKSWLSIRRNAWWRGISVHPAWARSFESFYKHIGPAPSNKHTVDRKNGKRGYVPGNVRWATMHAQMRNRKDNVWLTFRGKKMILSDWAKKLGITGQALNRRLHVHHWSLDAALSTKKRSRSDQKRSTRLFVLGGRSMTLRAWSKTLHTDYRTLWNRIYKHGWSVKRSLTENPHQPTRGRPAQRRMKP